MKSSLSMFGFNKNPSPNQRSVNRLQALALTEPVDSIAPVHVLSPGNRVAIVDDD